MGLTLAKAVSVPEEPTVMCAEPSSLAGQLLPIVKGLFVSTYALKLQLVLVVNIVVGSKDKLPGGPGGPTADPFLAFIRRVFWRDQQPTLDDGLFAVLWSLQYSIKAQPGGIAEPIQIGILQKENGMWKARLPPNDYWGQHDQVIKLLEDEILPSSIKKAFSETSQEPIPEK